MIDLAKFLFRRGRAQEAEKTFEQASAIAPGSPKVLFAKAESYIKAGRKEEARKLLKQYLTLPLSPDDPPREEALRLLDRLKG